MLKKIILLVSLFSCSAQAGWLHGEDARNIYSVLEIPEINDCNKQICSPNDLNELGYKAVAGNICFLYYSGSTYSCYIEDITNGYKAEKLYFALAVGEELIVIPPIKNSKLTCDQGGWCTKYYSQKVIGPLLCTKTFIGEYYESCNGPRICSKAPIRYYSYQCEVNNQ